MDFQKLVELYEQLEKISSGNEMRDVLSEFFKKVDKDIDVVAYLTLGKVGSEYDSVVLGLAEKSVLKAIAACGGVSLSKVKQVMVEEGDVGLTAEKLLKKKPMTLVPVGKLSISEFYETLHKIAGISGNGSSEKKEQLVVRMLQKVSPAGAKYVCRVLLGTLRMGVGDMTVLDSLAIAFTGEKKNKELLEKAYNVCPDVGEIALVIANKGLKGLEKISIKVGRPIKMMLAQRVGSLDDVSKKMPGIVAVEGKYDGERVQIHKDGESVKLFSRRLDLISSQFPDLVDYIKRYVTADNCIIEGEILAVDSEGNPRPFQTLMQRRRKYDVATFMKKVPIQLKAFDLLYCNGKEFMHEPYEKRVSKLGSIVKRSAYVMVADHLRTDSVEEIDDFFRQMLDAGYEGAMIKSLSGEYQAGTRGWNWIKWKKDYVSEMNDTFDLVIVGGFHGKGKRSGVYGALLCAVYDSSRDSFLTLCKVGTGLTDAVLAELPSRLKKVSKKPVRVVVKKEMEPDVWFSPEVVIEVLAAELTKSPFHTAGVALRFPRFVSFRDDKKVEDCTTLKEVKEMS